MPRLGELVLDLQTATDAIESTVLQLTPLDMVSVGNLPAAFGAPAAWTNGYSYTAGTFVTVTIGGTPYIYLCTTGGQSAGSAPTSTTTGATVTDYLATWMVLGPVSAACGITEGWKLLINDSNYTVTLDLAPLG